MGIDIKVRENGSFDITADNISLLDCYPGIDGRSIRAIGVQVNKGSDSSSIVYSLDEGVICLTFHTGDDFYITTEIFGLNTPPYQIDPIWQAKISGLNGLFIQKLGLRGEYGYFEADNSGVYNKKVESIGTVGLKANGKSLIASAYRHDRFINSYSAEPDFHQQGCTLFSAGFKLECTCTGDFTLPDIHFILSDSMEPGLKAVAEKIAQEMGARKIHKPLTIWSSWYYRFNYMNADVLKQYLEGFAAMEQKPDFDYFQIDGGYCTTPGDWLSPNYQWRDGLKPAFDLIKSYGYKPGIWIAPFIVGNMSELYINHPDWVIQDKNGTPVAEKRFYEWLKPWPNFDTEYYILDISHPDAMEYIIGVFKTLKEYGAQLFKTDFMLWSMRDSTTIKRHCPGKTSVEYFRDFLKRVRETIGEESYLLGCIAPFLPFVSYADGMRIAGDVVSRWEPSHVKMLLSKFMGSNYFNNIYWQNDPDVVIIRDFDTELSKNEATTMALLQAFTGGILGTSDPIFMCNENVAELFSFLSRSENYKPYYPFFEQNRQDIIACFSNDSRHIILIANIGDSCHALKYSIKELIGKDLVYIHEKLTGECFEKPTDSIYCELLPRSCRLYYCDENSPVELPDCIFSK